MWANEFEKRMIQLESRNLANRLMEGKPKQPLLMIAVDLKSSANKTREC